MESGGNKFLLFLVIDSSEFVANRGRLVFHYMDDPSLCDLLCSYLDYSSILEFAHTSSAVHEALASWINEIHGSWIDSFSHDKDKYTDNN